MALSFDTNICLMYLGINEMKLKNTSYQLWFTELFIDVINLIKKYDNFKNMII